MESKKMAAEEIVAVLHANVGKRVGVTFEDGTVSTIDISSVDQEGFVHSGPNGENPNGLWSRFEGVILIETEPSNSAAQL